jgi:hypothetical protein
VGNGCETGLTTNANCGACGHVCATGSNCQSGMCVTAPPPPARYLRARIPAGYACTWDLDVDPASAMFCAPTSGGEFYVDVSGVYWPGNHIRIGVATSDPRTTPASRLTWVVNDIANLGRTARSLGFTVLQFEQGGVVTDLLDSAQACVDVCHPAYPGWRETKVTVRTRSDASVCPITCDAR